MDDVDRVIRQTRRPNCLFILGYGAALLLLDVVTPTEIRAILQTLKQAGPGTMPRAADDTAIRTHSRPEGGRS